MKCKVCDNDLELFGKCKVLNKYDVSYFRCLECGTIQTEEPYWLSEAYSSAIADTDIGLVSRNLALAPQVQAIFNFCIMNVESSLDWGGGTGMFVRMLRDAGFDMHWYDKFCKNQFAKGFERQDGKKYDVVTAFELFEHLPNPVAEISELVDWGENIVFSTMLLPPQPPQLGEWWYYSIETGQHVTFYTEKALRCLAEKFGKYYQHYKILHIFSAQKIPLWKMRMACKHVRLVNHFYKRKSLLDADYERVSGHSL